MFIKKKCESFNSFSQIHERRSSPFLANSLFRIVAVTVKEKKNARNTRLEFEHRESGNPRRSSGYLKRGRVFRLAAFQRNFASTAGTKALRLSSRARKFIFSFIYFRKRRRNDRLEIYSFACLFTIRRASFKMSLL